MARHHRALLAIDPGLAGTGWALWIEPAVEDAPNKVGVIPPFGPRLDLAERCEHIVMALPYMAHDSIVVCEFPEFQGDTGRMMGWRKGDLQKLTFLVGYIAGRLEQHRFVGVRPSIWKGQLPKSVVEDRITERLGKAWVTASGVKTHAWDAVGIGLWFKDLEDTV